MLRFFSSNDLDLKILTRFCMEVISFYDNVHVPIPICCTTRQTEFTEQLEHVLERAVFIDDRLRGDNNGVRTEMTSALHQVVWKIMNLIHWQCEMKTLIEEPSSTGNLNKVVIHSLFTCYFVNTPHMLNGGSKPLLFRRKPVFCE